MGDSNPWLPIEKLVAHKSHQGYDTAKRTFGKASDAHADACQGQINPIDAFWWSLSGLFFKSFQKLFKPNVKKIKEKCTGSDEHIESMIDHGCSAKDGW